ncbi:SDR family NAD(P)-dependent oxidoreductase [Mycobacterium kyogaense]|uniref:SDR family NAD(P)-dependent oxidoreductase n=1 Tax=Mycobacterium kyogaense TaxID=2212479 RepID=UPI000DAC8F62|nr:SDR family oxidoreductase [Mycobacterium kyogaense]
MSQRCALVTGASRGIGGEIARRLAGQGYDLMLVARRNDSLETFAAEIRADYDVRTHHVAADLSAEGNVRRVAHEHRAVYDRLDLLVLNAGLGNYAPITESTLKSYDLTFNLNVRSAYILLQELLPLLRSTASSNPDHGAKVIALASIAGVHPEAGLAAYGASKSALISLCETVTLEECDNGITATALSPGFVDTDMTAWIDGPRSAMIKTADVAELVMAVSRLSANAAVGNIVIARHGAEPRRP